MAKKLTLRIEDNLIDFAKKYSRKRGKSISAIVSDYLQQLRAREKDSPNDVGPMTQSLRGMLKGSDVKKEDYRKYLSDKNK